MAINFNNSRIQDVQTQIDASQSNEENDTFNLNISLRDLTPGGSESSALVNNIVTKNVNTVKSLQNATTQLKESITKGLAKKFPKVLFDDFTDLDEEIENTIQTENSSKDLNYKTFSIESDFVNNNLKNILVSSSKENKEIDLPRVFSHEINKTTYKNIFATNECSILPSDIFKIKSEYFENTQISYANNYFLSGENQKKNRESYYRNLKNTNNVLKKVYKNISTILSAKEKTKRKSNFGNKIVDFYLTESKSSSLGRVSQIILDNSEINLSNIKSNKSNKNINIDNFTLNSDIVTFRRFDNDKSKIFDVITSTINSESSFLKNASEIDYSLNTDRLFGQILTNLSLSTNGFYKDSLSYDFYSDKILNSKDIESLNIIDSKLYHDIPIIKINSILSNETDSDYLFNPLNNDEAYTFGSDYFNLDDFEETPFDRKSYSRQKLNTINSKVFEIYKQNLYLENTLHYNSFLTGNSSLLNKLKSENIDKSEYSKYTNIHFNPFNFNQISYRQQGGSQKKYNVAYLDILPRNKSLSERRNVLSEISSPKARFSKPKAILNSTSFTYFLKSNAVNETMTMSNKIANGYSYMCIDSVDYLRSSGHTMDVSLRHFIDPISGTQTFINPTIITDQYTNINFQYENLDRSILHGNRLLNHDLDYKEYVKRSLQLAPFEIKDTVEKVSAASVVNLAESSFTEKQDEYNGFSRYVRGSSLGPDLENVARKEYTLGFLLLKNSLNPVPVDKIADKFIKYDNSLTTEEEYIPNRIIMSSSSKENKATESSNKYRLDNTLQNNKDNSFKEDNWTKLSFDIRRSIYNLKNEKLNRSGNTEFIDFLNSYKNKVKGINKVSQKTPYLSLLYSDETKYALDKYENSDFIVNVEDTNYKKFDYSNSSNNLKDTMELKINQEINSTFRIDSEQTKSFLSFYYPDNILKTSSTYFEFIKTTVSNIIKQRRVDSRKTVAYDKLVSDIILKEKDMDVASVLAISAIVKHKNIRVNDDYDVLNEKTDGLYESYINSIFSASNVKRQKSYTLRTVDFPSGENCFITRDKNNQPQYNPANITFNRTRQADSDRDTSNDGLYNVKIEDHEFDFGIVPGKTYVYLFPFLATEYEIKPNNVCSNYRVNDNEYMIVDTKQFLTRDLESRSTLELRDDAEDGDIRDQFTNLEGLYDYVFSKFYNYDVYLDVDNETPLYDFELNKATLYNVIRANKVSRANRIEVKDFSLREHLKNVSYDNLAKKNNTIKTYSDNLSKTLNYVSWGQSIKEYALSNTESQSLLKEKINDLFIAILKYTLQDFESEMSSITTLESATEFVNDNQSVVDLFVNLLNPLCNLYSTMFDEIVELSIKKNIYKKIIEQSEENTEEENNLAYDMWDPEVRDLLVSALDVTLDNEFKFEKDVLKENNSIFDNSFYTNLVTDIQLISKTLNNSDVCEIMSMDAIYSYVSEFERSRNNNIDLLNVINSLENLSNDLFVADPNNLVSDRTRLNFISKNINDYYYYQQKQYDSQCLTFENSLGISLRDHFTKIINDQNTGFYESLLLEEKSKSILAEQGMMLLNHTYNNYDIIRFGIEQDFAAFLSDKKLLKIKFAIVSHKNPDIYIPPIYKIYTPTLTNIMPSHLEMIKSQNEYDTGVFIDNFVGLYKEENDIGKIYNVVHAGEAAIYVRDNLLNKVNKERILNDSSYIIDNQSSEGLIASLDIVRSAIFSSAVKSTNYRTQKRIDEISLNQIDNQNFSSISTLSVLSKKEFESTFSESYESLQELLEIEQGDLLRAGIVDKKLNSVDFISAISKFSSSSIIENVVDDNLYHDIFSVVIGRKDIESQIKTYYEVENISEIVGDESSFFDSFSYMVEAEVL